jgi:hypothetical protein
MKFTGTICAESDGYVASCPELDIANQGDFDGGRFGESSGRGGTLY